MRQDWFEFERLDGGNICVRLSNVVFFESRNDFTSGEHKGKPYVNLCIDDGSDSGENIYLSDPYVQVKQKIMDAEKVDYGDVAVEHFTREEYESILSCIEYWKEDNEWYIDRKDNRESIDKLVDKLKEILKEEDE